MDVPGRATYRWWRRAKAGDDDVDGGGGGGGCFERGRERDVARGEQGCSRLMDAVLVIYCMLYIIYECECSKWSS